MYSDAKNYLIPLENSAQKEDSASSLSMRQNHATKNRGISENYVYPLSPFQILEM